MGAARLRGLALRALALSLLLLVSACARTRPPYAPHRCTTVDGSACVIESLEVVGNQAVGSGDIEDKIATAESHHVLAGAFKHIPILGVLDRLTVTYERLDPFVLERDLARVERYYRSRGYYEASARAGRVIKLESGKEKGKVAVEIAVDEGAPVHVAKVDLVWKDGSAVPPERVAELVRSAANDGVKVGGIFEELPFEAAKKAMLRAMTDHGFAYAAVEGTAKVDFAKREATVTYTLELGPHATFGEVVITGAPSNVSPAPLMAAVRIKSGDPFSTAELDSATIALSNFGIFGSVDAAPALNAGGIAKNPVVPVTFRVQPSALHSIKAGAGAEIGTIVEAHAVIGWENRNLFGGLRKFTVEARPGLVFYPKTLDTLLDSGTVHVLPEFRLRLELRQPGFLEPRTTGILRTAFNIYRQTTTEPSPTDLYAVGYHEVAGMVGVERLFWRSRVYLGGFFNVQFDDPFSYLQSSVPAGYSPLVIPYLQGIVTLDLRRGPDGKLNRANPHSGIYLTTDFQAGLADTKDLRIRPEIRVYLPVSHKVTLAVKVAGGLLVPFNYSLLQANTCPYPSSLPAGAQYDAERTIEEAAKAKCGRALQLSQFRAFFSGGPVSNRGYPYNGVGPHDNMPWLSADPVATGGLALWETSLELRFPLYDKLGTALFVDASDVTRQGVRICAPHLSTGLGLRYETPVGPFRADFGYRVPGLQVFQNQGGCATTEQEEGTVNRILGLPLAISVAIGEAF